MNQLDNVSFLRHGDIDEQTFRVKLDFIRDFRNVLGLLPTEDSILFMESLERDTTRQQIAKLASYKMKEGVDSAAALKVAERFEGVSKEMMAQEAAASAPVVMPLEYSLEDFCFQVYIEVSLIQHDQVLEPKLFTGVKYFYELKEVL